jgi:peptide/nickel transport system substrate-binding protein
MSSHLEALKDEVLSGRLNRRAVLKRSMALGLSAPVIASLLAACGGDDDDDTPAPTPTPPAGAADPTPTEAAAEETEEPDDEPTPAETEATPTQAATAPDPTPAAPDPGAERGGEGQLRLLWWQAPTILNSHLSQGTKDFDASRLILEPLGEFADDGSVYAVLAETVPSLEEGTVSEDGLSVTWTLKQGVEWHDGEPFTSADVQFTYEWIMSEGNTTTTQGSYIPIASVDTPDDYTVVVNFTEPNPAWFEAFVGINGRIIPRHIMENYMGDDGRNAPFNLDPIGTGPYKMVDFRPGDVLLCEINENYWDPGKPHFDSVEMKGGGEAAAAARAVLQTGEADYAWNLQVEANVLDQMEAAGDGILLAYEGVGLERILVNMTDPNTDVDGERSHISVPHPYLSELDVRRALAMACDRESIATQIYGRTGVPAANWIVAPEAFVSPNTSWKFDLDEAEELLEGAGWLMEGDTRQKDGVQMRMLYQTSLNSVRQRTQEIIKQAYESLGVQVEIKAIEASVYFSSDPGNPDTAAHFYADFEMYTNGPSTPYPLGYAEEHLSRNPAADIPQKANDWSGANYGRWQNDEYNELYTAAETELDPGRQAEIFIAMNDLVVENVSHIPLVQRRGVSAHVANLEGVSPSRWTSEVYNVVDWRRST